MLAEALLTLIGALHVSTSPTRTAVLCRLVMPTMLDFLLELIEVFIYMWYNYYVKKVFVAVKV